MNSKNFRVLCVAAMVAWTAGCASDMNNADKLSECGDGYCQVGEICCGDECVDVKTSTDHCGQCNRRCPRVSNAVLHLATVSCIEQNCIYTCQTGYVDKDGINQNGCESALAECGNHIVEADERCDMEQLGGWTCADQLGKGAVGQPQCNDTCTGFENGTCTFNTNTCGNGERGDGEICDGKDLGGMTCADVVGEGSTGKLKCGADCKSYDISGCSELKAYCGNGMIDSGELCDGKDVNRRTCADFMGAGATGDLKCRADCKAFDTSECVKASVVRCGNNIIDGQDVCDGTNLNGQNCALILNDSTALGKLKCLEDCSGYDSSDCHLPCELSDVRCVEKSLQMCDDENNWIEIQKCDDVCSAELEMCTSSCTTQDDVVCEDRFLKFCNEDNLWENMEICTPTQKCNEEAMGCLNPCTPGAKRCDGKKLYTCQDDGFIETMTNCSKFCVPGAGCAVCESTSECAEGQTCNTSTYQCDGIPNVVTYFTDFEWVEVPSGNGGSNYEWEYIQPNTEGYTLTAHARGNIVFKVGSGDSAVTTDYSIEGKSLMIQNIKVKPQSGILVSGLSRKVGVIEFDTKGYDHKNDKTDIFVELRDSNSAVLNTITDIFTRNEVKHLTFTINSEASSFRIYTQGTNTGDSRVAIDNLKWTIVK